MSEQQQQEESVLTLKPAIVVLRKYASNQSTVEASLPGMIAGNGLGYIFEDGAFKPVHHISGLRLGVSLTSANRAYEFIAVMHQFLDWNVSMETLKAQGILGGGLRDKIKKLALILNDKPELDDELETAVEKTND